MAPLRARPLLAYVLDVVDTARRSGLVLQAYAVVAVGDAGVEALVREARIVPIVNPEPERGLSSSLWCGLAALETEPAGRIAAALVLLGDQPLVRVEVARTLIEGWRSGRGTVLRPRYADAPEMPGHPVLLDRSVWPLARHAHGDAGLGGALPPGSDAVTLLDVPGHNPDVDTVDDLNLLKESPP
ncbi:MAG: NTP transferase domain-containing protein [Gemmatimonadales bacterium]|nr:NTP transferase domain-containing protein [Gemmatimonadales bacterium]MDQ3428209.1 NTP transferase domain-containing protein [Gemmatimonadota bacterium]